MPFGRLRASAKLTSLTTNGTSGSLRKADELSMTVTPAAANRGACTRDNRRARGEQRDVQAGGIGGRRVLDLDLLAGGTAASCPATALRRRTARWWPESRVPPAVFASPGRPARSRQLSLFAKPTLAINAPFPRRRRPPRRRPSSNASCRATTALSSSVSLIRTEIRISEVEIRSMLTPTPASASQNFAVTPGWLRMPAPTSDNLADVIVVEHPAEPDLLLKRRQLLNGARPALPRAV